MAGPRARRGRRDDWARRASRCALYFARGAQGASPRRDKCAAASAAPVRARVHPSRSVRAARTSLCCSGAADASCAGQLSRKSPPNKLEPGQPASLRAWLPHTQTLHENMRYVSVARSHGYLGCCLLFIYLLLAKSFSLLLINFSSQGAQISRAAAASAGAEMAR